MIRGYQSFRLIPSSKLSCPMVFPPSFITIYMKFLVFRFLSILSALYLCTVTSLFFSSLFVTLFRCTRPLQFVYGSLFIYGKDLCFRWSVPPLLRFHDLYTYRCSSRTINSFLNYLLISHPVLSYSFIFLYLDSKPCF